jgi:hypothetical protein
MEYTMSNKEYTNEEGAQESKPRPRNDEIPKHPKALNSKF